MLICKDPGCLPTFIDYSTRFKDLVFAVFTRNTKLDAQKVEPKQFNTWFYFDQNVKIVKHVDWINYHNSLIEYFRRVNSNSWINFHPERLN